MCHACARFAFRCAAVVPPTGALFSPDRPLTSPCARLHFFSPLTYYPFRAAPSQRGATFSLFFLPCSLLPFPLARPRRRRRFFSRGLPHTTHNLNPQTRACRGRFLFLRAPTPRPLVGPRHRTPVAPPRCVDHAFLVIPISLGFPVVLAVFSFPPSFWFFYLLRSSGALQLLNIRSRCEVPGVFLLLPRSRPCLSFLGCPRFRFF